MTKEQPALYLAGRHRPNMLPSGSASQAKRPSPGASVSGTTTLPPNALVYSAYVWISSTSMQIMT